ncbi:MAG: response regulator [Dehalococcoidia bacterium]|nr:MAG: response regulator [Dehalococcoidia bacterium]
MIANKNGKKRVLLIDDEERIVNFLALKLKVSGYEVFCAGEGEKGLELAKTAEPDIMLLDIIMPGIDGLEVLRRLRQFSNMPVIVLSAKDHISEEILELGANGFMSKPFNPDDLVAKIKTLLQPGCPCN